MRINILSVFLLLIIYSIPVHAQFDSVRSTLSISFGTAIPQYQYAMAKDNNEKAGYAKTGMSFNTEFIYHFYNYFGVCMNYSSGSNNPDETLLHDDMQDRAIDTGNPSSSTFIFDQGVYKWRRFMIGPIFYWFEKNYTVYAKMLAGNVKLILPDYESTIEYKTTDDTRLQYIYSSKDNQFSYLLGAGILFDLSPKLGLTINVDYTKARMEFNTRTINSFNDVSSESVSERIQPFSVLNIHGGIIINFLKKNK